MPALRVAHASSTDGVGTVTCQRMPILGFWSLAWPRGTAQF